MKLVLFTQHFPPHFEGGTESVVRAQARELARRGHEVLVVAGTDRPHAGADVLSAEVDGLPVRFLPRLPHEPYDLTLERPRLAALYRGLACEAELVHVHHWSTLTGSLVRDLGRERPVVVTLHDSFATCPRFFRVPVAPVERCPERGDIEPCVRCIAPDAGGAAPEALRTGLRARTRGFQAELDAARLVVVPSRAHGERLARLVELDPARLVVVHHGLSHPLARLPAPAWDGAGTLRVLHLGHRTEVKGTSDLVAALAALPPALHRRTELHLLGAEVEPGFDRRLRELAGELVLRFHGAYELDALAAKVAALGGAHLAALPSRVHESYGLVLDEALALGLPAWVSDRGAPKERVGAAGRVLPAEQPSAWTRAFRELFDSPAQLAAERRALPARGRTAADAAHELESHYARLLQT